MKNKYLGIISITYSLLIFYLYFSNNLKNYIAKNMFINILLAGVILLIFGIIILFIKSHHNKLNIIDLVLILPLIILLFSGNGRLTSTLATNRTINNKTINVKENINKEELENNEEVETLEIEDENGIYFNIVDESFVSLADFISFDERAKKYIGKRVKVKGFLVDYETMLPNNYYSIGRYVITCCAADANYVGLFFKYDKRIDQDEWYEIEGVLEEFEDTKGYPHLAVNVDKITEINGMDEEQYVYPCNSYGDGKCSEVKKYNLY